MRIVEIKEPLLQLLQYEFLKLTKNMVAAVL